MELGSALPNLAATASPMASYGNVSAGVWSRPRLDPHITPLALWGTSLIRQSDAAALLFGKGSRMDPVG